MLSWDSNEKIIKVFKKHKNLCDIYVAVYEGCMNPYVSNDWTRSISGHFQFMLYGIMLGGVEILAVVQGKRV